MTQPAKAIAPSENAPVSSSSRPENPPISSAQTILQTLGNSVSQWTTSASHKRSRNDSAQNTEQLKSHKSSEASDVTTYRKRDDLDNSFLLPFPKLPLSLFFPPRLDPSVGDPVSELVSDDDSSSGSNEGKDDSDFILRRCDMQRLSIPQRVAFRPMFAPSRQPNGDLHRPFRYDNPNSVSTKAPFLQNSFRYQQRPGVFSIDWTGQRIPLRPLPSNGQHSVVAAISSGQPRLLANLPNEHLIVKLFRDHCILVKGSPERVTDKTVNIVLAQYRQLLQAGLPVATLYNLKEAEEGCGFFLFEQVPHAFFVPWRQGSKIDELSASAKGLLNQLRNLFHQTYQHGIIPDLRPDNLRLRDDGTLTLVDLREQDIEDSDRDLYFTDMLKSFYCTQGDEIYEYLNPMN